MPYDIDAEPIVIRVPADVSVPANSPAGPEWNSLLTRVSELEDLTILDLADVSGTPQAGNLIIRNDTNDGWELKNFTSGITAILDSSGVVSLVANTMQLYKGFTVTASPAGNTVYVEPLYGTAANTIAQGNHTHSIRVDTQLPFPSSGSFSSGTRTLTSGNVTGLDPNRTYVIKGVLDVHLRGDGVGAGYTRPRITINGNGVDMPERPRSVAGVQPCYTMRHPGVSVTGVSSVAVSATIAYSEGDPTWVGGGALTISVESNR